MILNFLSVNTAWNREKVIDFLEQYKADALFIDLPSSFEAYFAKELFPPADVSYVQDLRASEKLIEYCWSKKIPVYCYLDNKLSEDRKEIQVDLARIALRSKLTGVINVFEWKKLIFRDLYLRDTSSEYIAMSICEKAKNMNACINIPPEVEIYLEKEGFEIRRISLYDFQRPIDRLYELALREMSGEDVSGELYSELIKKHLAFIDTVVEVGYEEACKFIWL
ncbi:MAG: hypothetical protein NZ872_05585 [Archaeoglobaceae archaeon]|nr:hypothetical protein [Archaeoglobaceae archaeon]MDW8128670.1 hypothetical protein [Archaeoglobaceae archaeon]